MPRASRPKGMIATPRFFAQPIKRAGNGSSFTVCAAAFPWRRSRGPGTNDVRIDLYGSDGDYTASGMDGLQVYVHGNAKTRLHRLPRAASWLSMAMSANLYVWRQRGRGVRLG